MTHTRSRVPTLLIGIGSGLFVFALWLSAYLEPDIRWLHFLQAWMYVGAVVLASRGSRWGYFIGFSAAMFWDYLNLFVTTFFLNGLYWLTESIKTGHLQRVDQIVSVPAWLGNFLLIVGCVWAYANVAEKSFRDVARLAVAFIVTTAFFAGIIALCQPRYLPLFAASLHPHWPHWKG